MEMEYGQKAPALPDGSLLIQEMRLTPEQSQQMVSEKKAILDGYRKTIVKSLMIYGGYFIASSALLIVIAVSAVTALLNSDGFSPSLAASLFLAILCIYLADQPVKKAMERVARNSAERVIEMVNGSEVEPVVFPLVSRYMPGDRKMRVRTYMGLVLRGESFLGTSKVNKVLLDTTDADAYVVREVVVN